MVVERFLKAVPHQFAPHAVHQRGREPGVRRHPFCNSAAPFGIGGSEGQLGRCEEKLRLHLRALADAALAYLRDRGVECEGVDEQAWGRFVTFADPDGNRWALQQIVRPS